MSQRFFMCTPFFVVTRSEFLLAPYLSLPLALFFFRVCSFVVCGLETSCSTKVSTHTGLVFGSTFKFLSIFLAPCTLHSFPTIRVLGNFHHCDGFCFPSTCTETIQCVFFFSFRVQPLLHQLLQASPISRSPSRCFSFACVHSQ
jgi:hypothetical protein